ncbi:hypothetical protein [Serratia ficaria]|uniref:hypothetical protein n=1 Tax=Serratia ficaria TaxID=61651 RepID=UPI00217C29A3|nr:hypothetical protein [Serratia ficaria]CAI1090805.1 Uncharacterised protein [Serratia ficaria]CAI2495624.1 Uncharacterised protein [Serratia ficaria]CAI2519544.1 Uncharacterised protein [Serratia ficaria]CAI2790107.1 Uncharacterised protein [Serratia ficaria]
MKQTEFVRRSTADQILKALIRGKLSRHVVYAYRKRHPNDEAGIEKTGVALERYRVHLLEQKRQPTAGMLALADLLDEHHPHANARSSLTEDMVERQKQLIKLAFGRDITTEQVFTLWAASNMNGYSGFPQQDYSTHRANNSQPRDEGM